MPSDEPVATPCAGCEKLTLHVSMLEGEFEACHRQHEQCMKLLEWSRPHVPKDGSQLDHLLAEMLSKGELPEGSL